MQRSQRTESTRLARAGLITLVAGMLLLTGWAIFPGQASAAESGNCDPSGTQVSPGGSTTVGGVTVQLNGTSSITVTGGTAEVCVKAGACFEIVTLGPGTHSLDSIIDWRAGNDCDLSGPPFPDVSHIEVISVHTTSPPPTTPTTPTTPTPPSTPPTTTSVGPTTITPPSTPPTTTSVGPTTITPPDDTTPPDETTVAPTTVTPPGGTAFTGLENVIPLGVIALSMMTAGSGLLWAGTRRNRKNDEE